MPLSDFTPLYPCPQCGADAWFHPTDGYNACGQCQFCHDTKRTPANVFELLDWCDVQLTLLPEYTKRKGLTPDSIDPGCHRVLQIAYELARMHRVNRFAGELGLTPVGPTIRCGEVLTKLETIRESCRAQVHKELLEVKTAGYRPGTELSQIVFELNNPLSERTTKPGEPVEVPNPFVVARRKWLPILKEHISKVPEQAEGLTEEKLLQWLRQKYGVPPTADLHAEQLVELFEREPGGSLAMQPNRFLEGLLDGPDDVELTPRDRALLEAHLRQRVCFARGYPLTQEARNKLNLILTFNLILRGNGSSNEAEKPDADVSAIPTEQIRKRSTERGDGRVKLIAALTKHHQYADGSCLNLEPIGNNELARLAGVAKRTASAFFDKEFQGHSKYKAGCTDASRLASALKILNGEFSPHFLFGKLPPESGYQDDVSDDD